LLLQQELWDQDSIVHGMLTLMVLQVVMEVMVLQELAEAQE
jgi:hypothetical protein